MNRADVAAYGASVLAVGTGVALARVERRHRPIAALFAVGLACDVLQAIVRPLYVDAVRPLSGTSRAWGHIGQAAFTVYPWAVLAVALLVLARARRRWAAVVGAAWALYDAVLVLGYHRLDLRGHRLGWLYLVAQVAVVTGLAVVVTRWWRGWRKGGPAPTASEVVALAACGAEAIILAGPMLLGQPWDKWERMARPPYVLIYVVAILVQGGSLWMSRRSPNG